MNRSNHCLFKVYCLAAQSPTLTKTTYHSYYKSQLHVVALTTTTEVIVIKKDLCLSLPITRVCLQDESAHHIHSLNVIKEHNSLLTTLLLVVVDRSVFSFVSSSPSELQFLRENIFKRPRANCCSIRQLLMPLPATVTFAADKTTDSAVDSILCCCLPVTTCGAQCSRAKKDQISSHSQRFIATDNDVFRTFTGYECIYQIMKKSLEVLTSSSPTYG